MASSNSYANGSVFTVKVILEEPVRRHEVVLGQREAPLYDPLFHLAVVQFEDKGTHTRPSQIEAAAGAIRAARQSNSDGAVVVVFIHGWHHSAAWKRTPSTLATDTDGDDHFHSFRLILESLALRETERARPRRVVGIYLGWNGDPAEGVGAVVSNLAVFTHSTFWNRYPVAERIGNAPAFRDTLRRIVTSTKEAISASPDHATALRPESPLIMIGHSMGALMLESGLLALLEDTDEPLIQQPQRTNTVAVQVTSRQGPVSFPDLILALNSAADSRIAKSIQEALEWYKLTKTASGGDISFSPPIMMSVTSTGDTDTRDMWRYAQGIFAPWRRTDGHDGSLFTHDFTLTAESAICTKKPDVRDFGQNWHCLRKPNPLVGGTPAISVDLPVRERGGLRDEAVPHARYTITPRGDISQSRPMWVFQVPPKVIKDHNDIFNSQARSLTLALIQISGAVASLADDWAQSFEPE